MDFFNLNSQASSVSEPIPDEYFTNTRKIKDPIHNFVVFDKEIWQFIDTPEFQRLRDIKQLGGVCYVFPSATHTRFEHSLGTSWLAQKQVKNIFKYQGNIRSELDSTENSERIQKNVTLAGLLHDIGHALFSHTFDAKIIPKLRSLKEKKSMSDDEEHEWSHEKGSAMLIDHLIEKNHIDIEREDVQLIQDLVLGNSDQPKYFDKAWIFDIVANKRNSIDVDKFDYMSRDSYHLGLHNMSFDYKILMKEARVINNEICFPAKLSPQIYDLFQARYKLFKNVYHNRSAESFGIMITEALLNANSYFHFDTAIDDPEEYLKLTDYIIRIIEDSKTPELEKSRQILKRIGTRDPYRFASECLLSSTLRLQDEERIKADIVSCAKSTGNAQEDLKMDDFELNFGMNNFALQDKNPAEYVKFFSKNNIKKAFNIPKDQVSLLLPGTFCEKYLRIFAKNSSQVKVAKEAFQKYCQNHLNVTPTPIESRDTPIKMRNYTSLDENSNSYPTTFKKFSMGPTIENNKA